VEISDGGIGIPAEALSKIFDRFYRAPNVTGQVPGTGLGLTGVRYVVEQHGGTVTVDSQENVGSTFVVRLPIEAAATPDAPNS